MNDFFAEIEEVFGYIVLDSFSDDLYDNNLYINLGFTLFGFSLIWMIIYYYVVNHPRLSSFKNWLIWIIIGGIINFFLTYSISFNQISEICINEQREMNYSNEFSILSLINFCWTLILCFIFSAVLKIKSSNASQIPF